MTYRLAVDLGTAFAAAAVVNGADPTMVGLGNRTMQVPSVLFIDDAGSFVVGETAERRGASEPDRLVREFKRRFGDPVPILVGGAAFSPESLMARLLQWIVATTTVRQGEPPTEIMLTHPANWGPYRRELLNQVVALADLADVRFCTEPEAAAVNYAARTKVEVGDRIAVYDLGGGTFDVCVLEKQSNGFTVLGTPDGIEHLGGTDIDEAVTQLVMRTVAQRLEGLDVDDPATTLGLSRLRRDCVDAKEALSTDTDVAIPVMLPGLVTTVRINRTELEAVMRPALTDTVAATRRTLASARVDPAELKAIVLVGGSSRIPLVGELLNAAFSTPLSIDTHPKHDVALGAALLCRAASMSLTPNAADPNRPTTDAAAWPAGQRDDFAAFDTARRHPDPGTAVRSPVLPTPTPGPGGDPFDDPDYLDAVAAGFAEQWPRAVELLQRVAARHPGQVQVAARLENAHRQLQIGDLNQRAAAAEVAGRWSEAADILTDLAVLQPDRGDVTARLDAARTRARADRLLDDLRESADGGDWQAVLVCADELEALAPERVPVAIVATARHEINRLQLASRYTEAIRQLDQNDLDGAIRSLEAIVQLDRTYRDAPTLLERARTEQQVRQLYEEAVRAETAGHLDMARDRWRLLLSLSPHFRDAQIRLDALTAATPPPPVNQHPSVTAGPHPPPGAQPDPVDRARGLRAGIAQPTPAGPAEPRPQPTPTPIAVNPHGLPRWIPTAGRAAAGAVLAALPIPLMAGVPTAWNLFAVISPFEILLAATALALASGVLPRRTLPAASTAGVFLTVGVLISAAGIGLVKFSLDDLGILSVLLSVVVLGGGITAVIAGSGCVRSTSVEDNPGPVEPVWTALAALGAGLACVALFVPYDGYSSLWTEVGEVDSAEFFLEPAAAVILLGVGLLTLRSRRELAATMVITTGAMITIHYLGVLIAAWRAIGEVGDVQPASWIGLTGGLIACYAGRQLHQRAHPAEPATPPGLS